MPKYKDKMRTKPYPDVYVVNPEDRVLAVSGAVEEVEVKTPEGVEVSHSYLGVGGPVLEKCHKKQGGWRFATKEEEKAAKEAAKEAEKRDREAMKQAQAHRAEAATLALAARDLRKGAEGVQTHGDAVKAVAKKDKGE